MRIIACTGLILAVLAAAWSLLNIILWGWLTATPLTPEQIAIAQRNGNLWCGGMAVCGLLAIASIITLIRNMRQ